jgi:hypothetical protein
LAQLLRQVMVSPHTAHSLLGKVLLLPRNEAVRGGAAGVLFTSAFFGPGTAPAWTGDLFSSEQGAARLFVGGFALVQRTVATDLPGSVFGVLLGVYFFGIGDITQRHRLRIFFVQQGLRLGGGAQADTAGGNRHQKNTSLHGHGELLGWGWTGDKTIKRSNTVLWSDGEHLASDVRMLTLTASSLSQIRKNIALLLHTPIQIQFI